MYLKCINCNFYTENLEKKNCDDCKSLLVFIYDNIKNIKNEEEIGVWKFKYILPNFNYKITLGEGNTPILKANNLSEKLKINLFIKDEGRNPTGSFIDRGSAIYTSYLREKGISKIKFFSTGNLGASMAAYCAKAGITCEIILPKKIEHIKLYQMVYFGAKVYLYDEKTFLKLSKNSDFIQLNPFFIEGLKTQIFEIADFFDYELPSYIIVPIGSGLNLFSYYKGLKEIENIKGSKFKIKFIGVKISKNYEDSFIDINPRFLYCKDLIEKINKEGILIIEEVSAEEVLNSINLFSKNEGLMVEPSSAVALAGLIKLLNKNKINKESEILMTITATGFKNIYFKTDNIEYKVAERKLSNTKIVILNLLKQKPMYAYEIWKKLKEININIKLPTLYEHIKELKELNLIESLGYYKRFNRLTNLYNLTEKGKKYLTKNS